MTLRKLHNVLETNPELFPRFVLPDGDYIPAHAHVTEVGHVVRHFIDCGGLTGKEEKALLQTHVGNDTDHRLRSDRFAKILELGSRVIPSADLDVDVEYDCCVVAQYPIAEARPDGDAPEPDLASRPDAMPGEGASPERNASALLRNIRDLLLVVMDLIEIYQCFCDRTRLRILSLLTRSPLCVCHFQDILGEPQVKISKHLAYLRSRGMVATKREQNWIIYSLPGTDRQRNWNGI